MPWPTYLVFDIETIPETEIVDMWNPEKEGFSERYPGDKPFPPIWCHKVVSIGMMVLDNKLEPVDGGLAAGGLAGGASELEMIKAWDLAASGEKWAESSAVQGALRLVDYNGSGFDVPVLQTRAFRYGMQMDWYFGLLPDNKGGISSWSKEYRDRYGGHHIDLQEVWTNKRQFKYPHLANLARLMGLPGKNGFDGSMVHQAYKDNKWQEIDWYCEQDVYQTALIFQRMLYVMGKIDLDHYRKAAQSVLALIEEKREHADFLGEVNVDDLLLKGV